MLYFFIVRDFVKSFQNLLLKNFFYVTLYPNRVFLKQTRYFMFALNTFCFGVAYSRDILIAYIVALNLMMISKNKKKIKDANTCKAVFMYIKKHS